MAVIDDSSGFNITLPRGADVTCTITNNDMMASAVSMVGVSAESTTTSIALTIMLTLTLAVGTVISLNKRQRLD